MIEVGRIADLIESLPFLFLVADGPGVVREEQLFIHEGIGDIINLESCLDCTKTVIGVVAEDEKIFVGETDSVHHITMDERSFKSCSFDFDWGVNDLLCQSLLIHRGERVSQVVFLEIIRIDFPIQ